MAIKIERLNGGNAFDQLPRLTRNTCRGSSHYSTLDQRGPTSPYQESEHRSGKIELIAESRIEQQKRCPETLFVGGVVGPVGLMRDTPHSKYVPPQYYLIMTNGNVLQQSLTGIGGW